MSVTPSPLIPGSGSRSQEVITQMTHDICLHSYSWSFMLSRVPYSYCLSDATSTLVCFFLSYLSALPIYHTVCLAGIVCDDRLPPISHWLPSSSHSLADICEDLWRAILDWFKSLHQLWRTSFQAIQPMSFYPKSLIEIFLLITSTLARNVILPHVIGFPLEKKGSGLGLGTPNLKKKM